MSAPTTRLAEHGARPFRHDLERRETDRGIEIALDGASVADAPPRIGQADTPIDAHSLAVPRGEPEELGIPGEEVDPRHARARDSVENAPGVGEHGPLVVNGREHAGPGVEALDHVDARSHLRDEIPRDDLRERPQEAVPERGLTG